MTFPFELVYEHFAQIVMSTGMEKMRGLLPAAFQVIADEQGVTSVHPSSSPLVEEAFSHARSKALFFAGINAFLSFMDKESLGMVVMAEAWFKTAKSLHEVPTAGLQDDPDALSAVLIQIYTKDEMRMGMLEINKDQSLTYWPLMEGEMIGQMAHRPAAPPSGTTVH